MRPVVTAGDEVVEHDVEPQPRRYAIGRSRAEEDGAEAVAREARNVPLRPDLRLAIGGDGIERSRLVDQVLAGTAVVAARGREHESLDAGLLGERGDAHAGVMVDGVGRLRIEIAQRIIGQGRQMQDGIDALEVRRPQRPAHPCGSTAPGYFAAGGIGAAAEEIAVVADDAMAGPQHHRRHDRADIAEMPRHHDTHCDNPFANNAFPAGGLNRKSNDQHRSTAAARSSPTSAALNISEWAPATYDVRAGGRRGR